MNDPNPYAPPTPPSPYAQGAYGPAYGQPNPAAPSRTMFILAGVGALATSAYWAVLALFIGIGAASGSASGLTVIMPIVLIALYAYRGVQLFKGDPSAASRLLWLHGVGGVMAVLNLMSPNGIVVVLYGLKVLLHIFGGVTALLALQSYRKSAALGR